MKPASQQDSAQAMQRVRVGMTGLAMVLVLIGLGSALFSSAHREEPISAIGGSNAMVVANMTDGNMMIDKAPAEPLAELGVGPSTSSTETVNAAEIARRQREAAAAQQQQ